MKKMTKKLGAILLAMAMCLSLCCTALAADGGEFTITVEKSNASYTYQAYKIFDATYDGSGNVSYTIEASNGWYNVLAEQSTLFKFTETGENTGIYTVTRVSQDNDQDIIDFLVKYVEENGSPVAAAATGKGTGGDLVLNVGAPGYYFVNTTTGSLVSITTAAPSATVVDKSTTPGDLDKEMVDTGENDDYWGDHNSGDSDIHQDTEAIGDNVHFHVTANVPLYDETNLVTDYEFDDVLSTGLYLEMSSGEYKEGTGTEKGNESGKYYLTDTVIAQWITIGSASDSTVALKLTDEGFVGDYYVELTNAYESTNDAGETVLIADGFILYYTTWDTSYTVQDGDTAANIPTGDYPADATIVINYYIHVTETAKYDNTNVITMSWRETPYNTPDPSNPIYTDKTSDTDHIYVLTMEVLKVDADNNEKTLEGATFKLTGENLKDVVVSTTVTYTALTSLEEYNSAKAAGTILYFELLDGTYTTVNPYDLAADSSDLDNYKKTENAQEGYEYTAYTRSVSQTTQTEHAGSSVVTGTTGANGKVTFTGLTEGDYTLTEIEAPDGYNLLPEDLKISIKVSYDNYQAENSDVTWTITVNDKEYTLNVDNDGNVGSFTITVEDNAGTELPSTGGIGTTIFYIIGGVLVVGAVVVLVTRRRMNRGED